MVNIFILPQDSCHEALPKFSSLKMYGGLTAYDITLSHYANNVFKITCRSEFYFLKMV
jgi:hypothetical protein